ncbi:HEAT repeat domain-containing protein [Candidatus Uabimicrobium amorphum]|uniref:Condensin complex subunit 1 C-terminal domain-containing protein n=1 Tax=Uabimicrobium amorphum TaxID=2596890 RepID=A0A5S9IH95_UABAM|nr:HEAT repeat domain-containing protein [Candidatus Uabimicrobium amorphum]BBM81743.1 hypothetical protein UABAM_00082 [Candidatus Uabimicrobium amorphum]
MANPKHIQILVESSQQNNCNIQWNMWRKQNPKESIDLSSGNLSYLDLSSANLHGATFDKCYLKGTVFTNCNLNNSFFRGCYAYHATFDHCTMIKTTITDCHFLQVQFRNSNLTHAQLTNSDLRGCHFTQVCCKKLKLDGSFLDKISFFHCSGQIASVENIKCSQCILDDQTVYVKNPKSMQKMLKFPVQQQFLMQFQNIEIPPQSTQTKVEQKSEPQNQHILQVEEPQSIHFPIDQNIQHFPHQQSPVKTLVKTPTPTTKFSKVYVYICCIAIFAGLLGIYFRHYIFLKVLEYRLHHNDPQVRDQAISALKQASRETQSHPQVIKILIARLHENVPEVRKKVLKVLNQINRPALKSLLDVLYKGNDKQRLAALEVIGNMRDQGLPALSIILKLLQHENTAIAIQATKTIQQIGDMAYSSLPILLQNLQKSANPQLQAVTIRTMSRMRLFRLVRPYIIPYLQSEDPQVCGEAALAIASSRYLPPQTIPFLSRRLLEVEDMQLKNRLLFCLGQLAKQMDISAALKNITTCIYDEDPRVALYAAQTLGHAKAFTTIEKLLSDKNSRVRQLSIVSFLGLEEKKSKLLNTFIEVVKKEKERIALLEQLMVFQHLERSLEYEKILLNILDNHKDDKIQEFCLLALGKVAVSHKAVAILAQIFLQNSRQKKTAQAALSAMGEKALPTIHNMWISGNRNTKIEILNILQQLDDIGPLLPLVRPFINDKKYQVRCSALQILVDFNAENLEPIIVRSLQDTSKTMRRLATKLFMVKKMKRSPQIHTAFMKNIRHENNRLRLYTLDALVRSGYYDEELLGELQNDSYHQVRNLVKKIRKQRVLNAD